MAILSQYTMTVPLGAETFYAKPNIYINPQLVNGVIDGTIPRSMSNLTWAELLSALQDSSGLISNKYYMTSWGAADISNPSKFESDYFHNHNYFPGTLSQYYNIDITENKYNTFVFNCSRYISFTAWNSLTSSYVNQYNPFYAYAAPSTTRRQLTFIACSSSESRLILTAGAISVDITYNISNDTFNYSLSVVDLYSQATQAVKDFFNALPPPDPDPNDPYGGGGYSGEGGGDGNFSEDSDSVDADPMPDESLYGATSCGLISIFSPTKTQLKRLADVIMGVGFWNFVQNTIQNISDLFVSLAVVPFTVDKGSTVEVTWWGYVEVPGSTGTGIYLTLAAKQWYEFDMGAISLKGDDPRIFKYGSVLDYSPYSKLGIYLPFIGYQELDIDECRDQVLYLRYRIDILSGTCVALISLRPLSEDPEGAKTIYQFSGNCLTQYPLTSVDASGMITNAVNIGIAGLSAGATSAIASAGDALTAENLTDPNKHLTAAGAELQNKQHAAMVANSAGSLVGASVNGVMGMKPNYKKAGAISSSASLFGVKQPYLFLTTPRQSYPQNYARYCGFPSNITGKLGSFSGYTVVEDIRLNGLVATSSEVEEIYALLKSGVIV